MTPAGDLIFELIGVSARHPASPRPALVNVTLSASAGEVVAVLGPNGAGKSTLLRVIAGTLPVLAGEARLLGMPLAHQRRDSVARVVALVPQNDEIRFGFSVRDVVMMGRAPHQTGWMRARAEDERVVHSVLRQWELEDVADRPVDRLSGGERKRVAVARAMAQEPRLLLLDEPSASLDVRHQVQLFDALRSAAADGTTCVIVTHDLQLAAAHAARVVLLRAGAPVFDGTPAALGPQQLEDAFGWPIQTGRLEGSTVRVFIPVTVRPALIDGGHGPGV